MIFFLRFSLFLSIIRWVHEANNELEPRVSLLEDDLEDLESESEDEDVQPASTPPPLPPKR